MECKIGNSPERVAAAARESGDGSAPSQGGTPSALLRSDDANALLREYARTRDVRIRNRLVALYAGTVHYLASRFQSGIIASTEDLVQVGYMGLIAAIERYDPDRGGSFTTFAMPTIVGVIKHYLRDQTWGVKTPRRLRELGQTVRKLSEQMEQRLGRSPTVPELAAAAGVPEERLVQALDIDRFYQPVSLDAWTQDEDGHDKEAFREAIGRPDPEMRAVVDREALRVAMERLDERQRAIIHARFFEEQTQAEVAARLGISQMHVSRLERQALRILRSLIR
jgi:RNA polymerase sigma-B factor